jgi:ATP-dependent DNA helicase PIF1
MAEGYYRNFGDDSFVIQLVLLRDVANIVRSMGKDIKDFGLPHLDESGTLFTVHVILIKDD